VPAPTYERPKGSPFTYPAYELTKVQTENLKALQTLSTQNAAALDPITLAEIHRELGQFAEALQLLETLDEKDQDIISRLITKLAKEKNVTVIRYKM
jgi:lipopolysaccharide biosynthesis regulator YciM